MCFLEFENIFVIIIFFKILVDFFNRFVINDISMMIILY